MRISILDGLRGCFLLMMMWVHLHEPLRSSIGIFNHHRISFADAAYGFVALSGLVLGIVFTRVLEERGTASLFRLTFKRLRIIYGYIAAVCVLGWLFINYGPNVAGSADPNRSLDITDLGEMLLLVQKGIPNSDVLPMYLVLVGVSPFAILLFKRNLASVVLAVSFGVWLLAQFGLMQTLSDRVGATLGFPGASYASVFVIAAWQLIFVVPLYIGFRIRTEPEIVARISAPLERHGRVLMLVLGCIIVAKIYVDAVRFVPALSTDEASRLLAYESKWLVTPIYLTSLLVDACAIYFLCAIAPLSSSRIAGPIGRGIRRVLTAGPLVALGRNSIQVFSAHILIVLVVRTSLPVSQMPDVVRSGLQIALTASLFLIPPALSLMRGAWARATGRATVDAHGRVRARA